MKLADKTVLVTGGSAGIGQEIAIQLRALGAKPVITGRNEQRLGLMADEGFETICADLSSPKGVDALLGELGTRALDILINNAGQGVDHDFREGAVDADAADDCIYANLNAPIRLIAGLLPRLRERSEAAIVNVTSGLAIAPNTGSAVYCATKAGLRSYTQSLRAQLADTNIHVIEALPPVVDTQMTSKVERDKMPPHECARQIIRAIERDRDEALVGQTKLLARVHSLSPATARAIMLRY